MMRTFCIMAALAVQILQACTDTATFVTATDIGISADANTEQLHIGYVRTELFQGPNYPDVGDAPAAVGFLGSNLEVFSPKIRQLYATGDAANLVTMPNEPKPCSGSSSASPTNSPDMCAEQTANLTGERRALVFSTATNIGLKVGFTGQVPSSIKFGFERGELSIIPLHSQTTAEKPDKYTSVLASIDMNLDTPSMKDTDLQVSQFFATGAAARNLAKHPDIRAYFQRLAASQVDQSKVENARKILGGDQADIKAYFDRNANLKFSDALNNLLKDPALTNIHGLLPTALINATNYPSFNTALQSRPEFVQPIAAVSRRLSNSGSSPSKS